MSHQSNPPSTAQQLLDAGLAASRRDDSREAIEFFAQAAAAVPTWALPHFLMGSEYAALGDWAQAEAELANAVLLDPFLHIARYQLGLLQFSSGRAAVALLTWQPLSNGTADPGLADFVRGFAALAQDEFDGARASFEQGLQAAGVNAAVADDIRKVIARMPGASEQGSAAAPAHVLVANYDRFKLH
jgi:tetratricopeptide (TPR) repeat protein